ncbi:DUF1877 family protein [Streptomyces aurantiogriseus]|uniref:DUF1877 domain-containing protein n=1 Tax=Streptomyces aurantiogriseus TaxID=66870 RepID=A0A918FBL1_9ACTN|nr:DUF1877 family protein [Streptomyces aurantiogriseus]GGR27950.1 hypothetical protein GCM10010251_49990 [Streptomyces aurantiogriseus]
MGLTQQFARVSPAYLSRCRESALDCPGGAPGWDPPAEDLLDTDWAVWGLIRYCRATGADAGMIAALERAIDGDPHEDVGFLDHDEVYDGFDGPPRLLTPDAVTEIAGALDAVDLDAVLAGLPASTPDAAAACGFARGFTGSVRAYLTDHFAALREFYGEAAHRGLCVVVWID